MGYFFCKAGKKKGGTDEYVFAYTNGKIFLSQDVKAYILGISKSSSNLVFNLKQFTTGLKQEIQLELKESTKMAFNEAIKSIGGSVIRITVKDSKNATEIRKTDKDIKTINEELKKVESLKPKNCDCDCGIENKLSKPVTEENYQSPTTIAISN